MGTTTKLVTTALGFILIAALTAANVHAIDMPAFPSCLVPSGQVKAQYIEGTHGIVGDAGVYTGADIVYTVNKDQVIQCFCPPEGQGIQTNWMKATGLYENEIEQLKREGWIYVPTGSVWGLENEAYLAKNTAYSCLSQGGAGSSAGGGGGSSSSGGSSSGSNGTGGGTSAGSNTAGLASTGSWIAILETAIIGAFFALGGMFVKKGSRS
ncbi:hypothetical protein HYS00_04055 [Candidatus Microgenomates bacterium]|nr:hypothetical protein [Candidatus Microgenomates bacterium]